MQAVEHEVDKKNTFVIFVFTALYKDKAGFLVKIFVHTEKKAYFCSRFREKRKTVLQGSLAQLNRASDYGSEGYRFESCRSHNEGWLLSSTE